MVKRISRTLPMICCSLVVLLLFTDDSVLGQERVSARRLAELFKQNEALRAEIKNLRAQLEELRADFLIFKANQTGEDVELKRSELDRATLSHGDAGLMTLLRLEKVRLHREAGMLDEAVQELKRIIGQNLSEETTNAARWTLIEVLQQQNKDREALAELDKILSTIKDPEKKRDALYGIISLSGRDPRKKTEVIDRLIGRLRKEAIVVPGPPAEPGLINLDPYVTWSLKDFHSRPGAHLTLEPGKHRLGGVDFLVGNGVIQLAGEFFQDTPKQVEGIKVVMKFRKLHILHGTGWGAAPEVEDGTRIGSYVVHYHDGSTAEIPIEYGVHARDWYARWGDAAEVSGGTVAWTGENSLSPIRLYSMTWENPHPEKVVMTIDFTSAGTVCAPFLVAMTAGEALPLDAGSVSGSLPAAAETPETREPRNSSTRTETGGLASYRSEKPLYARVAVNEDGSKILSAVFDESRGTGRGYDVLYADVDFNGKFERSERIRGAVGIETFMSRSLKARSGRPEIGGGPTPFRGPHMQMGYSFLPINLDVPYNDKGEGLANPCQIIFSYKTRGIIPGLIGIIPETGTEPNVTSTDTEYEFFVRGNIKLREDSELWEYAFEEGIIRPSESLESAPVWSFNQKPTLEVAVRPDGRRKANAGIGLKLWSGSSRLEGKKGGSPLRAHVEIKKPDGEVVHRGDATVDKFTFG